MGEQQRVQERGAGGVRIRASVQILRNYSGNLVPNDNSFGVLGRAYSIEEATRVAT